MQKITPFLWFDKNVEETMNFYISVFKDAKVLQVSRYPEGSPMPAGMVMTANIMLNGMEFALLNGGPEFKFNESISFVINCEDQAEVDYYWGKLTEGGSEVQCGWLKDKFGLSWQVIPKQLSQYVGGSDPAGSARAMQAMLKMKKIVVEDLKRAYEGD